jgi:hypothetical protein
MFPEGRREQKWATGKPKGQSGKTISYYLVCRAVAPSTVRGGSVPEKSGQVAIFFIKDQLEERLRYVADYGGVVQSKP